MKRMDKYFGQWGKDKLLQYDGPVIPFNTTAGTMKMIPSYMNQEEEDELIADTAREQLEALIKRVESSGKKAAEKDRVVMLTRTNNELQKLAILLKRNKLSVRVTQEGSFFTSEAVRDFFCNDLFLYVCG